MRYFNDNSKNHINNFKISLANLFIELNKTNTANQLYSNFSKHPLQQYSKNIYLGPQFVEDLTESNFGAILQTPIPTFNIEQELSNCVNPQRLEQALSGYRNQLDNGNIKFIDSYFDPINIPHLALLTNDKGKTYSWKTVKDEQSILVNGEFKFDSNLDERILATLQVYKNK
jgi:hypothetical protein